MPRETPLPWNAQAIVCRKGAEDLLARAIELDVVVVAPGDESQTSKGTEAIRAPCAGWRRRGVTGVAMTATPADRLPAWSNATRTYR